MPSWYRWGRRSKHDLHSIGGNLPACALSHCALGRACQQRRIRIVDMQEYLAVDIEASETFDRAFVPGHRHMPHALPGLGAEACGNQLVVAPDRAVEEYERRAGDPRFQLVGDLAASRDEIEIFARRLVADAKPYGVAVTLPAAGRGFVSQIPCNLAGNAKGQDFQAACRSVGQGRFERPVELDDLTLDVFLVQHVEDAVGLEDLKYLGMSIDGEGRALAHRQETRHRVDLAVGEDDARNRRIAQPAWPRVKLRRRDQLLAQVGGGIDQKPMLAIRADCDGGLRASEFGMFATGGAAHLASAIPLRNAASCRGAQDDDAHDPSPSELTM